MRDTLTPQQFVVQHVNKWFRGGRPLTNEQRNLRGVQMGKRKAVSDYIRSSLMMEINNRCPLCGKFEGTKEEFTDHHINHDPLMSEYWNLIRICQRCHDQINNSKQDGKRDRKIRQVKKHLFRGLIGPASHEVLLLAYKYKITSTLPCLANSLLKLELISVVQQNSITVGIAEHPTIGDYKITDEGKNLVEQLGLQ